MTNIIAVSFSVSGRIYCYKTPTYGPKKYNYYTFLAVNIAIVWVPYGINYSVNKHFLWTFSICNITLFYYLTKLVYIFNNYYSIFVGLYNILNVLDKDGVDSGSFY